MATRELDPLFDSAQAYEEVSPDRELTLSFQRGDRWAYDLIFRRYSTRVQGVCRRMLSDPQDAQDAVQETFLRVYQNLPRFKGEYQLGAWITRIATNVCLDQLRSRSRTPADAAPNDVLEEWAEAEPEATPEEALLRSVEGMRVHETLASLSPLHRRAITMRDLEGRDYRDIASTLGVPEARARVLLHRARKGFKKSWTSAGIFLGLPTRLLQRIRRLRDPDVANLVDAAGTATHASHAVTANAHHLAASCSQVVSQCGGVVSEKIAAAATAALVGVGVTATGGASVALSTEPKDLLRPAASAPVRAEEMMGAAARAAGDALGTASELLGNEPVVTDGIETESSSATPTGALPSESAPPTDVAPPETMGPEPTLGNPVVGPDVGSPVDPGLGGVGPVDTPAGVPTGPVLLPDTGGSPAPSPEPSAPAGGADGSEAPPQQEPPGSVEEPTSPTGSAGEAPSEPDLPTIPNPVETPGNAVETPGNPADTPQSAPDEEPPLGEAPNVDPPETPGPGLGPVGEVVEETSGGGLLG